MSSSLLGEAGAEVSSSLSEVSSELSEVSSEDGPASLVVSLRRQCADDPVGHAVGSQGGCPSTFYVNLFLTPVARP